MIYLNACIAISICLALLVLAYGLCFKRPRAPFSDVLAVAWFVFLLWPLIGPMLILGVLVNHSYRHRHRCTRCRSNVCERRYVRLME